MDTIFAEATPPGRGGVSVVRISGPDARGVLESVAGRLAEPRKSYLRALHDGKDLIDHALVIWFETGKSFTGEEVAELHLHGAPVIRDRLIAALLARGLRRAEAGEFSRRAFLNERMDLSEAEGLADLLSAETELQRQLAMRAVDGEVKRQAEKLRALLVRAGALVEVSIDFADEDVPDEIPTEVFTLVKQVCRDIADMLQTYPATERLREGYTVAIIGPPNSGKSTLLNRIARRDIALVSDIPGTTRDIIELATDLRGLPVTFLDTAGLRETEDPVEKMGVERALKRASDADLRIYLSEDGVFPQKAAENDILLRSKSDLRSGESDAISGLTGEGVAELMNRVYDLLRDKAADTGIISNKRQAESLSRALADLNRIEGLAPELVAENLRRAAFSLSSMLGRVGAEDYLDEIFSSFCIGK